MPYYSEHTKLWLDGQLVNASDARIDLYSQSLHYGYSVFEGIRSYKTTDGATRIFKAVPHYERLLASATALNMPCDRTVDEMINATYAVLEANDLADAYIRPIIYAPANMSFVRNEVSHLAIQVWEMQPFLGERLLRVGTSSYQRPNPKGFHIHAKAGGHYVNSILASQDAKARGYDEALLLDMDGYIAEAPGANIFFEKDGKLFTPAPGHILAGITRATVIGLCEQAGIPVEEKKCSPEELKTADAAFFCGTAAEIIGIASVDDISFTKPWTETTSRQIQDAYQATVRETSYKPSLQTV